MFQSSKSAAGTQPRHAQPIILVPYIATPVIRSIIYNVIYHYRYLQVNGIFLVYIFQVWGCQRCAGVTCSTNLVGCIYYACASKNVINVESCNYAPPHTFSSCKIGLSAPLLDAGISVHKPIKTETVLHPCTWHSKVRKWSSLSPLFLCFAKRMQACRKREYSWRDFTVLRM